MTQTVRNMRALAALLAIAAAAFSAGTALAQEAGSTSAPRVETRTEVKTEGTPVSTLNPFGATNDEDVNTTDFNPQGANATNQARIWQMHGAILFLDDVLNDVQLGDDSVIGLNQQAQHNRAGTQRIFDVNVEGDIRFKQADEVEPLPPYNLGVVMAANQVQHSINENAALNNDKNDLEAEAVLNSFAGVNAAAADEDGIEAQND